MDQKLTQVGWLMTYEDGVRTIIFKSAEIYVWVTSMAIIVYDCTAKVGYAVRQNVKTRGFEGEHRQLFVSETDVYAPDHTEWLWLTEDEKTIMLKLLRKVVSYRTDSLPDQYKALWQDGVNAVRNLEIVSPGEKKYYSKFLPGFPDERRVHDLFERRS